VHADFNGDGHVDLAIADEGTNQVGVYLGRGDGTFGPATNYPTGAEPNSLNVGDLNGDGLPDLVTGNTNAASVSVLINNGSGFNAAVGYSVGSEPRGVAIADFNGDGAADLAVANSGTNTISVLLNTGAGHLGAVTNFVAAAGSFSVVARDFDGDGHMDFAAASNSTVTLWYGTGSGSFSRTTQLLMPVAYVTAPDSFTSFDVDGDGRPDLVSTEAVRLNTGAGGFADPITLPIVSEPISLTTGDFNGDGRPDFAINSYETSVTLVFNGSTFVKGATYSLPGANSATAADFNGDGLDDLAVVSDTGDHLAVFLNTCR
jgi:hypothetical protein